MKLWNYIKDSMLKNPEQTICEKEISFTFKNTAEHAENLAEKIKGEKCCVILCRSELTASVALLACLASGVTAVPLPYRYGELYYNKIIETLNPSCMLTDLNGGLETVKFSDCKYTEPKVRPAVIMFTSGTTGKPKGVMLSEENLLTNLKDIKLYFNTEKSDTILISRPLYHCAVMTGEFFLSLANGSNMRFYSEKFNPKTLADLIVKHKITVFCSTPTLLNTLTFFFGNITEIPLRHISISGECMDKSVGERIAKTFKEAKIHHVYGLTEASPRVCFLPYKLFSAYPDCVGIPLESVRLKILKPDGNSAKQDEEGILWIKGKNIMLGYYNDPILTEKRFDGDWFCTGDVAVIGKNGLLKIKGRNDNLIIRAGMNIYPQEIESVLKQDNRVREVLVYGISNDKIGTQIAMKIVGNFSDKDEIKKMCINLLPAFQIPTVIEIVDAIPKNGFGKIIRRKDNA